MWDSNQEPGILSASQSSALCTRPHGTICYGEEKGGWGDLIAPKAVDAVFFVNFFVCFLFLNKFRSSEVSKPKPLILAWKPVKYEQWKRGQKLFYPSKSAIGDVSKTSMTERPEVGHSFWWNHRSYQAFTGRNLAVPLSCRTLFSLGSRFLFLLLVSIHPPIFFPKKIFFRALWRRCMAAFTAN